MKWLISSIFPGRWNKELQKINYIKILTLKKSGDVSYIPHIRFERTGWDFGPTSPRREASLLT
jgi:hypothetical protein